MMYKVNEIKELIRSLDSSSIDELTIKGEGDRLLSLRRSGISRPESKEVAQLEQSSSSITVPVFEQTNKRKQSDVGETTPITQITKDETLHEITCPMVGTFYESSSPEEEPYVKTGDHVSTEKVVCIVEAMKLMNELEADVEGEIVEVLVKNGELVEYGQPLFKVKKKI